LLVFFEVAPVANLVKEEGLQRRVGKLECNGSGLLFYAPMHMGQYSKKSYHGMYTIVSRGQVGVDEGALRGAVAAGVRTAGYMPKGFICAGEPDPAFAAEYNLKETTYGKGTNSDRDR
jgi:hypothetical protein